MSQGHRPATLLLSLAVALAGCGDKQGGSDEPLGNDDHIVEGWVLDPALRPIEGALVAALGIGMTALTNEDGEFVLHLPAGQAGYTLRAAATGFQDQSRTLVFEAAGQGATINFTMQAATSATPRVQVDQFDGFIECSAFAAVGHSHGGSGRPEGENPTDCGTYTTTQNVWDVDVPSGVDAIVVEIAWDPDTELARYLLAIVDQVHDDGSIEYMAFGEGESMLKIPIGSLLVEDRMPDGGTLRITVEIGGSGDDVAVGAAVDQRFQGFTSLFYNMLPDPQYSVAN